MTTSLLRNPHELTCTPPGLRQIIIEIVAENLHSPDTIAGDDVTRQCWSGTVFASTKFDILGELAWGLEVIYLAFVALQIILALGNRPKGERLVGCLLFRIGTRDG